MNYKIHKIVVGNQVIVDSSPIDINENDFSIVYNQIAEKIINIAESLQENRIGFRKIGSNIGEFNFIFENNSDNLKLHKATENKRSTYKLIFDWLELSQKSKLIIFTFEKELGKTLVDESFITLNDIIESLNNINKFCSFKKEYSFYILVARKLDGAVISKAQKVSNKQYYKIYRHE